MARRRISFGAVLGVAVLVLLPSTPTAEIINVNPGPDAEWNYLYDYGDVEVGSSGVMIFQIENDSSALSDLTVVAVYIEDTADSFTVTDAPALPSSVAPGESVWVETTFEPGGEGFFKGVIKILSDASNIPPGGDISFNLRGTGIAFGPPPEELMQDVLYFYAGCTADEVIHGLGSGGAPAAHVRIFGDMLEFADDLIAVIDYGEACAQLDYAVVKSDGLPQHPDFIAGPAVPTLNTLILDVMDALGCD